MITADQLLAHAVGDYLLQSHWMATEKVKRNLPAALHAGFYGLPFLFLTRAPLAFVVIIGTHFVIDRWRLARYVVWAKNWLLGSRNAEPDPGPVTATGYPEDVPPWLAVWLLIIADNVMHVLCNGAAIWWLA